MKIVGSFDAVRRGLRRSRDGARRLSIASLLICAAGIGGCASQYDFDKPPIDMRGVDEKKYAADFNECMDRKIAAGVIFKSPTISDCMRERGYTITAARG